MALKLQLNYFVVLDITFSWKACSLMIVEKEEDARAAYEALKLEGKKGLFALARVKWHDGQDVIYEILESVLIT